MNMLVRATRIASALSVQALFFGALFIVVVVAHVAITTALRAIGWGAGTSLAVSGSVVLLIVIGGVQLAEFIRERSAAAREVERLRQALPSGPCCVLWSEPQKDADLPWRPTRRLRADYPMLARRLGIEGVAVVGLEISADGTPKNVHCIDSWPSKVFYQAAAKALYQTRFRPLPGAAPQPDSAYRVSFEFRIAGAARPSKVRPSGESEAGAQADVRRRA